MSIKASDVDRAWKKLEMRIKENRDRHALFYVDGKLVLRTKRSMGSGKLDGKIPGFIRQQMKLDERQFADLINCPLTRDGYIEILRDKGYV